ncbi:hypothetical protein HK405_006276, partial [Cladochytrium tenue]
ISPMLLLIDYYLRVCRRDPITNRPQFQINLLFINSTEDDVFATDELAELEASACGALTVVHLLSKTPSPSFDLSYIVGTISEEVLIATMPRPTAAPTAPAAFTAPAAPIAAAVRAPATASPPPSSPQHQQQHKHQAFWSPTSETAEAYDSGGGVASRPPSTHRAVTVNPNPNPGGVGAGIGSGGDELLSRRLHSATGSTVMSRGSASRPLTGGRTDSPSTGDVVGPGPAQAGMIRVGSGVAASVVVESDTLAMIVCGPTLLNVSVTDMLRGMGYENVFAL